METVKVSSSFFCSSCRKFFSTFVAQMCLFIFLVAGRSSWCGESYHRYLFFVSWQKRKVISLFRPFVKSPMLHVSRKIACLSNACAMEFAKWHKLCVEVNYLLLFLRNISLVCDGLHGYVFVSFPLRWTVKKPKHPFCLYLLSVIMVRKIFSC